MVYRSVAKVDEKGKKIRGKLAIWKTKNPGKLYFDSTLEWECWKHLKSTKLKFDNQPTIELFKGMKTKEFKKGVIKETSQQKIKFTPDFYLHKYKVYIEAKGYAEDLFRLRWKLFKIQGYEGYIVYSVAELKLLLEKLKNEDEE